MEEIILAKISDTTYINRDGTWYRVTSFGTEVLCTSEEVSKIEEGI